MRHVFVETNWVVAYAAPAHHKIPAAVNLLERARRGEFKLHLPAFCMAEARRPLMQRCQPRNEADAIRGFLAWAKANAVVEESDGVVVRRALDKFEAMVKAELAQLDDIFAGMRQEEALDVFPMNDAMLETAIDLAARDLHLKPFDQAVLAATLVRAHELGQAGAADLTFCELDSDLQPWDKGGNPLEPLTSLYADRGVWVNGDFTLTSPRRPEGWPGTSTPLVAPGE